MTIKILGDPREILEVRNAIKSYEQAHKWNSLKETDLLKAHSVMMSGLAPDAGKYRSINVGIIKGSKVGHVAPKPKLVPHLMSVESVIRERQAAYYQALSASDRAGDATIFIEFALTTIRDSLAQLMEQIRTKPLTTKDRLEIASSRFGSKLFSRKD